MNNIDQLFKNKLDNYEATPSLDAWSKIESGLTKKNKGALWMKIAASIILLMTVGIIYQQSNSSKEEMEQIASDTTENNKNEVINSISSDNEISEKSDSIVFKLNKPNTQVTKASIINNTESAILKSEVKNEMVAEQVDNNNPRLIEEKKEPIQNNINDVIEMAANELIASNTESVIEPKEKNSCVKIVYNLEPVIKVDSSILEKKATENNMKDNVLGKIVAFAKNAKSSDVSLGNLRAAKDDFLSLDNLKSSVQSPK